MKPHSLARCGLVATVLILFLAARALVAAPTNTATAPRAAAAEAKTPPPLEPDFTTVPRTEFVLPKKKEQGRDPFFPASTRSPSGVDATNKPGPGPAPIVVDLALKGFSGTDEKPLAIINTTNFEIGEESDVITKAGRMKIRCLEINRTNGTVVIQLGGERRELRLAPLK